MTFRVQVTLRNFKVFTFALISFLQVLLIDHVFQNFNDMQAHEQVFDLILSDMVQMSYLILVPLLLHIFFYAAGLSNR
jgi:hypothetical protein